ncbi:MAG: FtsX-like permease family protein [Bdellovibrionaceae bacterium]|nr:FtsX-like permease family protein [Pseudobdellovibrionaceae bacterium]
MLFRWAVRELLRSWRISLFFIMNLSLGLTGFIALESYKNALENQVRENRLEILGADLALSARRELTDEETAAARSVVGSAEETTVYDFFAMVGTDRNTRLALVKAVQPNYPLYGRLEMTGGNLAKVETGGIWISPEMREQLQVTEGQSLKLGNASLQIRGVIERDTSQTFRSAGIAPRVFISSDDLAATGLIQFGSTFSKVLLFKLPPTSRPAGNLQKDLYQKISDPSVRIETADETGEDSGRQMKILSDFLGLVALVALFLAALGAAYIWRLFLQQRTKDVAILRSLGLDGTKAILLYVLEASLLGIIAIIPAVIVAQVIFPILNRVLASLTPFDLAPFLTPSSILVGLGLSLGTSLLVALPFLLRLREIRPARLFSEEKFKADLDLRKPWALLPALAALWGLAVLQSKSFFVGSIFTAVLLGVLAVLAIGGWILLRLLANLRRGPWDLKQGLRSAGRRRVASLSVFLALGLGSLLMNILPQIKVSLQKEIQIEGSTKLPSLFMFDIQDEQLSKLEALLRAKDTELVHLSPLIRSRLIAVNGTPYERTLQADTTFRTREEENEARFRNRGVNLSYRAGLSDSEELVDGRPLEGRWDIDSGKLPELSVEWRYAERMGLKIGDTLKFDVQGVEIEGTIVNLRKVRWTSFQPNFFVLMQDGALNDAPKTWIAAAPKLSQDVKNSLQAEIANSLGNVSMIDVENTVRDVMKVADQMSWSLELMAGLALLTGAVVLFSIARGQAQSRRWELNLLKVLGASPMQVRRYLLAEFAILAGFSSLLGSLLSLIASSVFLWQLFDGGFAADWGWVLGTSLFVTLLGLLVAERASAAVVSEKPLTLLRSE